MFFRPGIQFYPAESKPRYMLNEIIHNSLSISFILKIASGGHSRNMGVSIKASEHDGRDHYIVAFQITQPLKRSYADLEKKAAETSAVFYELSEKINAAGKRMGDIVELQKNISNYSRTKEIYIAYRDAGYSKKFRAEHEEAILLHQAAKRHFDSLGLTKLPTIKTLKQEYARLLAEKKTNYAGLREAKENMRRFAAAKANADAILGTPKTKAHEVKPRERNSDL